MSRWDRDARHILKEVAAAHPPLRKLIGDQRLRSVGHGQSSIVFALGNDRVVRVSRNVETVDCEVPQLLLGRPSVGWPEVHDVILVDAVDGNACIVVAERVDPWSVLPRKEQRELDRVADLVATAHVVKSTPAQNDDWSHLPARAKTWAKQLWSGLRKIDRLQDPTPLDTLGDNFGLNRHGQAVWVDYGV